MLEISDRKFFQFIEAKDEYNFFRFHPHFDRQPNQTAKLFLIKEDDL
jgi:hypothetical protein